jgi:hypothetical protein
MTNLPTLEEKPMEISHFVRSLRLDDSLFSQNLAPHYMELAKKLASSELVPKCYRGKPQDLFLCWALGYQIGLAPEQAMQCISMINGKAAMWGDDMLALCMTHKDFEDIEEHPMRTKDDTIIGYVCTVRRKGMKPKINEFTLDMAKKAGLLAKGGVWTQYPERMLKLRARGFTLRDAFPDALKGIKSREEVEDYITIEPRIIENEGTRTEQLKKDLINRQGDSHVDSMYGSITIEEYNRIIEENTTDKARKEENQIEDKAINLHSEIMRLIAEKEFTDDRLNKALAYYEVDTIEELSKEAAENFITKLMKI